MSRRAKIARDARAEQVRAGEAARNSGRVHVGGESRGYNNGRNSIVAQKFACEE